MTDASALTPDFKPEPFWWAEAPCLPADAPLPAHADVVIVGSGYCGLMAALTLARAGVSAVVLDAGDPGIGASTRNHGHVGGAGKLPANLDSLVGSERARHVREDAISASRFLRDLIADEKLDVDYVQRGRFLAAHSSSAFEGLRQKAEDFRTNLGLDVRLVPRSQQRSEIGSDFYHGGLVIEGGGALHPAKLHREMRRLAEAAGVVICGRAGVTSIGRTPSGFTLATASGEIRADKVVIATNAYTGALTPWIRRRLVPVTAYMATTEPMPLQLAEEILPKNRTGGDTKRALYAFRRSPDGLRLIFAGRAKFGDTDERDASAILHGFMSKVWPQLRDTRIQYGWKGFVAFTFDFMTHMGEHDGMHYAAGCQGAGVTLMSYLGHQIGLKILGHQERPCGFDGNAFPTLPTYSGRPWFLPAVGAYYRARDSLDRALSKAD
jgi:glycine/D-amino acid oxidase-like deaminating enzyme